MLAGSLLMAVWAAIASSSVKPVPANARVGVLVTSFPITSRLLARYNKTPATNGAPTTVTAWAAMIVGVRSKFITIAANATVIPVSNTAVVSNRGAKSVGLLPSPKPSERMNPPIIDLSRNDDYAAEKRPRQKMIFPWVPKVGSSASATATGSFKTIFAPV